MREWSLHVDESGNFDDPEEVVLVAGAMFHEPVTRRGDEILRAALKRMDPLIPYPPHATELALIAWWVAAWRFADPSVRVSHPARAHLDRASEVVERNAARPELATFTAALAAERRPSYEATRAASDWLARNEPGVAARLRALTRQAEIDYQHLGEELQRRFGPDGAFVVAAMDPGRAHAITTETGDRYLSLLVVLFERIFAVLRARPAERHVVRVTAAVRHVSVPLVGRRPLRPQDLGDCVRRAERFALDPPSGPVDPFIRVVPGTTPRYDQNAPPGIVLADFVARGLRHAVRDLSQQWSTAEARAERGVRFPASVVPRVTPGGARCPTVAAVGEPRARVALAFAGGVVPPAAGNTWMDQQADAWITVATAL